MKTALIFGSSGLIGNELFKTILLNNSYDKIKIFVRSVPEVNNPNRDLILIENKNSAVNGSDYSGNIYDIRTASQEGVIYPSLDPSIFELKRPNSDIEGKVVGDR